MSMFITTTKDDIDGLDPDWIVDDDHRDWGLLVMSSSAQTTYDVLTAAGIYDKDSDHDRSQDARSADGWGRSWPIDTSLALVELAVDRADPADDYLTPRLHALKALIKGGIALGATSLIAG